MGGGVRLMLRPEWVDGVELQMIWGLGPENALVIKAANKKLADSGVSIEWKGEQRLLQTGKANLLLVEEEKWDKNTGVSYREEREGTDPRKLVFKPLAKHLNGRVWEYMGVQYILIFY